jgi:hypothetical protein
MAEWTECPSCSLKHALREDGRCPRCRQPVRGAAAADPAAAPSAASPPPDAAMYPPPEAYVAAGAQGAVPAYAALPETAFTVGRFLSAVLSTWGRNVPWVVPLALLGFAPGAAGMGLLFLARGAEHTTDPGPELALAGGGFLVLALLVLVPVVLAAIARAGVRRLRREPVTLGDMLGAGWRSYLPALGLLLLVGLAYLGTACTVAVPFVLLTGWAASLPALVTERLGPIEAMKRSWELTRGLRWQVFGGFFVLGLIIWAVACLFQAIVVAAVAGVAAAAGGPEHVASSVGVAQGVSFLAQGLEHTLLSTGTAVVYHQLRIAVEGPATTTLGQVFE